MLYDIKVIADHRVTIPRDIRVMFNIKLGDWWTFEYRPELAGFLLKPKSVKLSNLKETR